MKRLIGYARVSTEQQAQKGVSLAAQEERIRAYVAFVGAELVDLVVDCGLSGRRADRPGKLEVVRRTVSGEADGLVVYAIDRLSRSTIDLLSTVRELADADRGFVSCREQLDSSTPHGRFTLTILAGLAEMESDLISSRTKDAMGRLRTTGRAIGRLPYPFRRVDGAVVEDPEGAEVVRRILRLRRAGSSYGRIARDLNEDGVEPPRGRKWYPSSIRTIERGEKARRREARARKKVVEEESAGPLT